MMSMPTDPLVAAMRSGAGLPVLSILDHFLEAKSRGEVDKAMEDRVLGEVLDGTIEWLDEVEAKVLARLDQTDEGPLRAAIADFVHSTVVPRRRGLEAVRQRAAESTSDAPAWAMLEAEFLRLHTLRRELHDVHRAATHLREVARLVTDIPDDESGRAALDELARLEALAATQTTPPEWVQAARELERLCMRSVNLEEPDTPASAPGSAGAEGAYAPSGPRAPGGPRSPARPAGELTFNGKATNGHVKGANGHVDAVTGARAAPPSVQPSAAGVRPKSVMPRPNPPTVQPARPSFVHGSRLDQRQRSSAFDKLKGARREPTRAGAAGADVLEAWKGRVAELTEKGKLDDHFRHAPFWAPIAWGVVVPPHGDVDELLEFARDVEIDLVEIEVPRIIAMSTGSEPSKLRERIAERAREITLRDPKQPARSTFLDYLVGKLPMRYRESAEGLALVESISYALCTDEPWESSEHDYAEIVRNMVAAELERSPAIDLEELSVSLIGFDPEAPEIVETAVAELATADPSIQVYPDGIVVRALAQREDPDKLYKLRAALESRLGAERAAQLIKALITAGEEDQ